MFTELCTFHHCCCSVTKLCPTLCDPMNCNTPDSPSLSLSLFKFTSVESVMPSNHLILCCSLLLLPSIFPNIRVFLMSQFFTSGGQSIGASASSSVLPVNIQDWSPLWLTGLISLMSKGLSRVFSSITVWNHQFLSIQPSVWSKTHVSLYMTIGKAIALTIWTFVDKVMSPLLLSRFVIAFLPRSKCLNFVTAVTIHSDFGGQEKKICHCFHSAPLFPPSAVKWWD